MTPEEALFDVANRLDRHGVRFALVGGLAVSIRAEIRFTRDVDLAIVATSDAEVESLTRALAAERFATVAVVLQDERQRIAIARVRSPSGVVIDLLAASSGIEREIVDAASAVPGFPGVLVATPVHLLAMKVLSMSSTRLQDQIDARNLLAAYSIDLSKVEEALDLIDTRGYSRGQDLRVKLAGLLVEASRGI